MAPALAALPRRTVTWFARGPYDRLLVTLRDRGHVIGLPLINGGASQHENSPYYPIPYANDVLSGVADGSIPQLLPRFELADGAVLAPLAYFRDVTVSEKGPATIITYRQTELDHLGGEAPKPDRRLSIATTYLLEPGRITRTDVVTPAGEQALKSFALEFASFGDAPASGGGGFRYAAGPVTSFAAEGFDRCAARPTNGDKTYQTPTGAFRSVVRCEAGPRTLKGPITLRWSLSYQ
jgi:hypothetical protein